MALAVIDHHQERRDELAHDEAVSLFGTPRHEEECGRHMRKAPATPRPAFAEALANQGRMEGHTAQAVVSRPPHRP